MKKKLSVMLLSAAMCISMLAGCGSTAATSESASGSASGSASASASGSASGSAAASADAAGTDGTIVFATNPEFPPFEYITTDGVIGEYDGIDMAIAKEIGERAGMKVEMQSMEFDSLLVALQNGQIDATIAGMTVTEERAKTVDFSTPYYTATQVMIVKDDSDIAKASDMEGKTIAVVQGYTGETVVQELGYNYEAFKKGTECVMELVNGKCDVVVIDSATAEKYVADNEGLKIVEDSDAFDSEEYAIAVQKGNTELLSKINAAIDDMLADGTISDIAAQYIDSDDAE
jgi:arginine/lysine/histidine transporter system substrate-binding protein